jgi:hypothetical protein
VRGVDTKVKRGYRAQSMSTVKQGVCWVWVEGVDWDMLTIRRAVGSWQCFVQLGRHLLCIVEACCDVGAVWGSRCVRHAHAVPARCASVLSYVLACRT